MMNVEIKRKKAFSDDGKITEKKFRLIVTEVPVKVVREGNTTATQFRYDTVKTNEHLGKTTFYLTVKNNKLYGIRRRFPVQKRKNICPYPVRNFLLFASLCRI